MPITMMRDSLRHPWRNWARNSTVRFHTRMQHKKDIKTKSVIAKKQDLCQVRHSTIIASLHLRLYIGRGEGIDGCFWLGARHQWTHAVHCGYIRLARWTRDAWMIARSKISCFSFLTELYIVLAHYSVNLPNPNIIRLLSLLMTFIFKYEITIPSVVIPSLSFSSAHQRYCECEWDNQLVTAK